MLFGSFPLIPSFSCIIHSPSFSCIIHSLFLHFLICVIQNSVLQALFMTPQFRTALFSWQYNAIKDGDASRSCARQLQRLFARLQLTCRPHVRTEGECQPIGGREESSSDESERFASIQNWTARLFWLCPPSLCSSDSVSSGSVVFVCFVIIFLFF